MFLSTPMSGNPTQTRAELDEEEALHYRAMARRLADMAMRMAEAVLKDAEAPQDPNTPTPDHTARFERASRTVRRCILLARKLAEPLPQPRPATNPPPDRTAARKRIIREVEDEIYRKSRHEDLDTEALEAELLDRLDRPDLEDDIATRPIAEIITDIIRDLGIGFRPDHKFALGKRRTPEDLEHLDARAAQPRPPEPRPPRMSHRAPPSKRFDLPDDPAEAIAKVLAMARIRDG